MATNEEKKVNVGDTYPIECCCCKKISYSTSFSRKQCQKSNPKCTECTGRCKQGLCRVQEENESQIKKQQQQVAEQQHLMDETVLLYSNHTLLLETLEKIRHSLEYRKMKQENAKDFVKKTLLVIMKLYEVEDMLESTDSSSKWREIAAESLKSLAEPLRERVVPIMLDRVRQLEKKPNHQKTSLPGLLRKVGALLTGYQGEMKRCGGASGYDYLKGNTMFAEAGDLMKNYVRFRDNPALCFSRPEKLDVKRCRRCTSYRLNNCLAQCSTSIDHYLMVYEYFWKCQLCQSLTWECSNCQMVNMYFWKCQRCLKENVSTDEECTKCTQWV